MVAKRLEEKAFISIDEAEALVMSLAEARGDAGFTESEAMRLIEWAGQIRFWYGALGIVLKGRAVFDLDVHGDPVIKYKE
jgi:hypothetical protein